MKTFEHVLMIGCGAVGKTTLLYWDIIIPHITYSRITIIEPRDIPFDFGENITHLKLKLTKDNYTTILDQLNPEFVLDLSVGVDTLALVRYCLYKNILYLSTAMENWENHSKWDDNHDLYKHSLVSQQRTALSYNDGMPKATILLDHGMNPGLISHFTKVAIDNMSGRKYNSYAEAAYNLGIFAVVCSEVDSQTTNLQYDPNVFYNTWSSVGLIHEGLDPVQVGWGSDEPEIIGDMVYDKEQRILPIRGMDLKLKSYNPISGEYVGMCIPHGESVSIPRFLTYQIDSTQVYRPSAYYVYSPSDIAKKSLDTLRERNYIQQDMEYVLTSNDITSGQDAVGSLIIKNNGECYWAGTIIEKKDVLSDYHPYVNPTCLQVACGVLTGVDYIANNRKKGVIFPEEVDSYRVFELCGRFLGKIRVGYVDYRPNFFKDTIIK